MRRRVTPADGFRGGEILHDLFTLQQEMKATAAEALTSAVNEGLVRRQFARLKQRIEDWNEIMDPEEDLENHRFRGHGADFRLACENSLRICQSFFLEAYDFFSDRIGDLGLARDEIKFTT